MIVIVPKEREKRTFRPPSEIRSTVDGANTRSFAARAVWNCFLTNAEMLDEVNLAAIVAIHVQFRLPGFARPPLFILLATFCTKNQTTTRHHNVNKTMFRLNVSLPKSRVFLKTLATAGRLRHFHASNPQCQRFRESNRTKYAHSSDSRRWTTARGLLKPGLFAAFVTVGCFGLAAYETERATDRKKPESWSGVFSGLFGMDGSQQSRKRTQRAPEGFLARVQAILGANLTDLSPPMKAISALVCTNVAVFLAWQVPGLQSVMSKYFLHWAPDGAKRGTMLLSGFSHMSLPHLGLNMLGLWSFGSLLAEGVFTRPVNSTDGRREWNGAAYEFSAFFTSAVVVSSLVSQLNNVRMYRGLASATVAPSLGASGGVYAIVSAVALLFPWTNVGIFLIPIAMKLGQVFPVMCAVDFAGLLLRWQSFDHAAHLGGAAFGVFYITYGRELYANLRARVRTMFEAKRFKS